jgi:TRAP-type C4-dicarboxylate transport system permease small subunit
LPERDQWLCTKVVDVLMIGICVFVMVWGAKLSMETMRQGLAELPWLPVGYTYLPLPIGCFLILLFVIENALAGPQSRRAVVTFDHEPAVPMAQAN